MKKNLKQIILACLLLASCQDINSGWRDWFTPNGMNHQWDKFKSWASTQWTMLLAAIWRTKQDQSTAPVIITSQEPAVIPSYPQKKLTSEEELIQAINTFIDNLRDFSYDLSDAQINKSKSFNDLLTKHKDLIVDLDSIAQYGIPESIESKLSAYDKQEIRNAIADAFTPLKTDLPWYYLTDIQTLQQSNFSPSVIKYLIKYIRNKDELAPFKDYALELNKLINGNTALIKLPPYANMNELLKLLHTFKIQQAYETMRNLDNKNLLQQRINKVYKDYFPLAARPDLTFIIYFA